MRSDFNVAPFETFLEEKRNLKELREAIGSLKLRCGVSERKLQLLAELLRLEGHDERLFVQAPDF